MLISQATLNSRENIPYWLKMMGKMIRSIPNFHIFKGKLIQMLMLQADLPIGDRIIIKGKLMQMLNSAIRGKGYQATIDYDLGQKIHLCLDDWLSFQIFLTGYYMVERKETDFFKKLLTKKILCLMLERI